MVSFKFGETRIKVVIELRKAPYTTKEYMLKKRKTKQRKDLGKVAANMNQPSDKEEHFHN